MREPGRRQRADARRSTQAVLQASITLLGKRPDASMDEIAVAAGVARQTVYAHYPSRQALLRAVTQHLTEEVARELGQLDLNHGSPTEALRLWLDTGWALLQRYPVLLTHAIAAPDGHDEAERHQPITGELARVIERGRRRREFDPAMPTAWYLAAIIGLGHAAGQEVAAGRMTAAQAGAAFRESVLKICRTPTRTVDVVAGEETEPPSRPRDSHRRSRPRPGP